MAKILPAILCTVLLCISACKKTDSLSEGAAENNHAPVDAQHGDMLVVSSIGEPLNLIPAIAPDSASHEIAAFVYNGLVSNDKDLALKGELAESWEISEDNLKITFHLRDDVKWHDGEPFTADDVIFTYNFMLDPNTPTPYDDDYRRVKSIHAPDKYTVVVEYEEPYAPALTSWTIWIMPKHLLENTAVTKSPLQRAPVGTGPFMFESWKPNDSLTLKANPDYFEHKPFLNKVMFRYFKDQSTSFLELLSGSIDFMGLTPTQYAKQTDNERFKNQYDKYEYISRSYAYVGYNLSKAPFDDVNIRKALTYATPKQQIIDIVLQGYGVPAEGPYLPGSFWHNDNVVKYDYNPDKARELLEQAGYKPNNKGVLSKDGKAFSLTIATNQNSTRSQIAEILQKSWGELGIDVSVRVLEWGTFLNEYINKRNFDVTVLGWNIILDPDPFTVWHSRNCNDRGGLNFACFKNEEADKIMEEALLSFDQQTRKAYYDRFQEILAEEQPYTFLYVNYATIAASSRLEGLKPAPAGLMYNLIDWYVPSGKQKYNVD